MMSSHLPRRLLAAAVLMLAPVAVAIAWAVLGRDLPEPLATHWGLDAEPDGFTRTVPFLAVATAVVLLVAALGSVVLVRARAGEAVRPVVAVAGFTSWTLACATIAVLLANHGHADAHAARSGWSASLVVVVLAGLLGALSVVAAPVGEAEPDTSAPDSGLRLRPDERVTWVGTASSRPVLLTAVVVGALGAVLVALTRPWGLLLLLLAAVLAWTHSMTVRVDDDGVRAHFGPLAWPCSTTRLDALEQARAMHIQPLQWGGWGWRVSRRGTALVARRGPGLVLSRRGRRDLAITVDRAEEAAEVVNALLVRRSAAGG